MLVDDLEVRVGQDLASAVIAARAKIEFCVLQCDVRGNDSFQSLDAFGDDFLPDAVTGNYCEFQICHVAIVARGRQVGRRCPYFGVRRAGPAPSAKPAGQTLPHPRAQTQPRPRAQTPGPNPATASCPAPGPQVSTPIGSIDATWRHRIAQKPQCPSSKRCQSRQPVPI